MSQLLEKPIVTPPDFILTAKVNETNGAHPLPSFDPVAGNISDEPKTLLLTREMVALFEDHGFLKNLRYQLINGRIVVYMPQGTKHRIVLMSVIEWLLRLFTKDYLQSQANVDVHPEDHPTSQPEPDVAVLAKSASYYPDRGAPAADVRLVVEVSNSTLAFDTGEKADLYARSGIADYWVVDIPNRSVIVHRNPDANQYQSVRAYTESERIAPLAAPGHALLIAEILPPADEMIEEDSSVAE